MDTPPYEIRTTCRVCGSNRLEPILSLGELYVSDFVSDERSAALPLRAPLDLVLCDPEAGGCSLLQLPCTVSPERLYRQYWYKSSVNQTMRDALADVTKAAKRLTRLSAGDLVLDIGCNDGTLLRSYGIPGLTLVGFEPARNLLAEASVGTSTIINDFFSASALLQRVPGAKAKVVTSIAMFYDLDDPNAFVADVKRLLAEDGVFIIQQNYLLAMLEQNVFDNIMHEHLEYYSLHSLQQLLTRHGLEVFDVELNEINGGSFRTFIAPAGRRAVSQRVRAMAQTEEGLRRKRTYREFAERVTRLKAQLAGFIRQEVARGKKVYAYGASTRGNTLLQYCGLDHTLITAAAERNPIKYGRRTVGTNIPIISEEQARRERPDYFLILPWAFLKEFRQREAAFLKTGGKFLVPLPEFRILDSPDEDTAEYVVSVGSAS